MGTLVEPQATQSVLSQWGLVFVAVVAQLVERQIVILNVAGSSPVDRPNFLSLKWGENKILQ